MQTSPAIIVLILAALAAGSYQPQDGERVGVVICGGNTVAVDFNRQLTADNDAQGIGL